MVAFLRVETGGFHEGRCDGELLLCRCSVDLFDAIHHGSGKTVFLSHCAVPERLIGSISFRTTCQNLPTTTNEYLILYHG